MNMLMRHTWLGFRRSHYYEHSMGLKLLMLIVGFFIAGYLLLFGLFLPLILDNVFPDQPPHESFFSLLWLIYAGDLMLRIFMQKPPKQLVQAYMGLPVRRKMLARFILVRSWFSLYNYYLFLILAPFYLRAVLPISAAAFWYAILGSFLLAGINHSLVMWIKTRPAGQVRGLLFLVPAAVLAATLGALYPKQLLDASMQLGLAFISGNAPAFILPLAIIFLIQWMTSKGLQRAFYAWQGEETTGMATGSGKLDRFFASFPGYGQYWELEWRMLWRNRRASGLLKQIPLTIIGIPLFFYFMGDEDITTYTYLFVLIAGGHGFNYLQYAYSWESRFFDWIATRPIDMHKFIRAKYYFHAGLGFLQLIPVLVLLSWHSPKVIWLMAGMFFYVTGPLFAFLMHAGVKNSTRMDPNKRASFNMEGTSGTLFLTILVSMLSVIGVMVISFFLPFPSEQSVFIVATASGLLFIVFHKRWTRGIAKKFLNQKHQLLNKYRER